MRFATNNSERMRIDSSGNLGLGILNPAAGASSGSNRILNIASGTSSGVSHITFGDSNAVGKIEQVNGNGTIAINATTAVTMGTSGSSTERMRIDSSGNIGIGTDNPTGPNALTNNNATLAVGIVTANEYYGDGSGLTNLPSSSGFDAGTVMLFRQTAAPTGWTKDTSNNNNSALRIVTGSVTTGGSDDFSTTFGTSKTTASHTLALSEIPAHTHTVDTLSSVSTSGSNSRSLYDLSLIHI